MRIHVSLLILGFLFCTFSQAGVEDCKNFNVKIRFTIASPDCKTSTSTNCDKIRDWLQTEIEIAEAMFDARPSLRIIPEYRYDQNKGGKDLVNLSFANDKEYSKYMDEHFDNVAISRVFGYLQVLVSDSITIDGRSIGGRGYFPHTTNFNWFGRKYGLTIVNESTFFNGCSPASRGVFAHELGHSLGLLHTFDTYTGGSTCNKDYQKGEAGKGDSIRAGGTSINVMDYEIDNPACPRKRYLNECQSDLSSKKLKHYLTNDCEVNYKQLRGAN